MIRRSRMVALVAALCMSTGVAAGPAQARQTHPTRFAEVDLVSDLPGRAKLQDDLVRNPWGLALGPTSPLWVANNHTDTATIYSGDAAGVTKRPLIVSIDGGAPTGQVFNDTQEFTVNGSPAVFMFSSESGNITAWNPATGTTAVHVGGVKGAIYKGLALIHTRFGVFLLAPDFHNNRIDVWDHNFTKVDLPRSFFHDPTIPRGYAPFNIAELGGAIFVTYAKQDADAEDDVAGPGFGFVDVYSAFGAAHTRFAGRGPLNAPWGLAIAPKSFGDFAGDVLIGDFGDGRINAYSRDGRFKGQLKAGDGKTIAIDGLWALTQGTATTGGTGSLWFSAGLNDEENGLVGLIRPAR